MRKFLKRIFKVLPPKESEKEKILKRLHYDRYLLHQYLGEQRMEAYEFYWLDAKGGYHIMGVLAERRQDPARVTQESVMQWGKTIFSEDFYPKNIFFSQVTMDKKTGEIFRAIPFTIPQKDL